MIFKNTAILETQVLEEFDNLANPEIARHSSRFFKSFPGGYGEGDEFLGIRVPETRKLVRKFREGGFPLAAKLLNSPVHEIRLFALLLFVDVFRSGNSATRDEIFEYYLNHTTHINNWDLVDSSAPYIPGAYLYQRPHDILLNLAQSENLWERRIAMMSCFFFIRHRDFGTGIRIAGHLLHDHHDLIHKAVGWMLREIGKRDFECEKAFIYRHGQTMPRTMLRYAIEAWPNELRTSCMTSFPARNKPRNL